MNNQNNNFDDRFDNQRNKSLPEEIKFDGDSGFSSGKEPKRGGTPRVNRALYVTAIVLLLSVAIIAAVTSAANRSKKTTPPITPESTPAAPSSTPKTPSTSSPETTPAPETTAAPETTDPSKDVSNKLPEFELPVSGVLSVGHDPDLQVFSPTMQEYRVHLGVDINTTEGAPVYSAAKGTVTKIWNDPMMGWCIEVSHSGDAKTYYKNLAETMATGITEGATVKSGQLLGSVGDSAMMEVAQEPHLHFEITVGGKQEDPLEFFATDVLAELGGDENYED